MATAVAIMDRASFGANTDVIVVVDPEREALTWVPRDLWCEHLGERVNAAYAAGGHRALAEALAEHGIEAAHSVCVRRDAVEAGIEGLTIAVPVREPMSFWYPLSPTKPIEQGRRRIVFEPPVEVLTGERIHQWIGARYGGSGSDLDRIRRQQELVAVALGDGTDFSRFLSPAEAVRASDGTALEELSRVRPGWLFRTLGPLRPATVDGRKVLMRIRD